MKPTKKKSERASRTVVNKAKANWEAATFQWNRGLESNRIKGWRLNAHPFFTVLMRTGSRSLWQSQAHFSLAQAKCLLFLHDQLMRAP